MKNSHTEEEEYGHYLNIYGKWCFSYFVSDWLKGHSIVCFNSQLDVKSHSVIYSYNFKQNDWEFINCGIYLFLLNSKLYLFIFHSLIM